MCVSHLNNYKALRINDNEMDSNGCHVLFKSNCNCPKLLCAAPKKDF